MTLQTRVESRCLAKIEALDTTIVGQGANQRRLGVIYLQIGWQTDVLHCKWTVNSRFLLQIEAWGEGENQLRLGVIYLQIGWQTSERMILQTGWKASLGLLKIEVLDTMIDDEGENQLRLGVIY